MGFLKVDITFGLHPKERISSHGGHTTLAGGNQPTESAGYLHLPGLWVSGDDDCWVEDTAMLLGLSGYNDARTGMQLLVGKILARGNVRLTSIAILEEG